MNLPQALGLGGDLLTFIGGAIAAWDAIRKESEFQTARKKTLVLKTLSNLTIEEDGIVLKDAEDVEHVYIRHSVRLAKRAFILLFLGFLLLLVSRILEIYVGHASN